MNLVDVQQLVRAKELGFYDMGSITLVQPTGRYIDAYQNSSADHDESRHRWIVEVKGGLFGSKWWVRAQNLKAICWEAKQ